MTKKPAIHILQKDGDGAVKKEGSTKASKITETKKEAESAGKDMAKNQKTELVIHNKDGKISDKDSYGNDPASSKDKVHVSAF